MARTGIFFGVLFCGVTAMGLFTSMDKSTFQFFPMMLGIPVLFLGVVGLNPHRRRAASGVSLSLAISGLIVSSALLMGAGLWGQGTESPTEQLFRIMGILWWVCLVYIALLSRWFLTRNRKNTTVHA